MSGTSPVLEFLVLVCDASLRFLPVENLWGHPTQLPPYKRHRKWECQPAPQGKPAHHHHHHHHLPPEHSKSPSTYCNRWILCNKNSDLNRLGRVPSTSRLCHRGRDQHRPGRVPSTSRQRIRIRSRGGGAREVDPAGPARVVDAQGITFSTELPTSPSGYNTDREGEQSSRERVVLVLCLSIRIRPYSRLKQS
jgi:hypothetical protein